MTTITLSANDVAAAVTALAITRSWCRAELKPSGFKQDEERKLAALQAKLSAILDALPEADDDENDQPVLTFTAPMPVEVAS